MIKGISLKKLNKIPTDGGNVLHFLKKQDPEFENFGEIYFSELTKNFIRAWKKHNRMKMNLCVPKGKVAFVFFDDRHNSLSSNQFQTITLSEDNYSRITVEKGIWFGFKGLAKNSLIANLASIEHDPSEVQRCSLDQIEFDWKSLKE